MNLDFTPRNVSKFVVKSIVAAKASDLAEDVITDHTSLEEHSLAVNITSGVVGWYVSDKLKPYTDRLVDEAADFITAQREKRAQKKEAKK